MFGIQGRGGSLSGYCATAASTWDSAHVASSWYTTPATPVQQNDPRHFACIKRDRAWSLDQQRKAAQAAENRKAVDASKEIEKAIKEGGGSSSNYAALAASSWDATPAPPVQQNALCYPAPIKQDKPSGPDRL